MNPDCPVTVCRCAREHISIWKHAKPYDRCRYMLHPSLFNTLVAPTPCGLQLLPLTGLERQAIQAVYAFGGEDAVAAMYPTAILVSGTSWRSKWRGNE